MKKKTVDVQSLLNRIPQPHRLMYDSGPVKVKPAQVPGCFADLPDRPTSYSLLWVRNDLKKSTDSLAAHFPSAGEAAALIQRTAGGDASALTALYDCTSRFLLGLVLRVIGDWSAAEEVLLDVYTQVWRQAASYDPRRGSPLAWLIIIARTRAIDRLRSGAQSQQRSEPLEKALGKRSPEADPEQAAATAERETIVRSALESLSTEQREVIELAYYRGLSHREIAMQLGQPLGTVKTRTRLGMIKLLDLLGPLVYGL